MSGSSGAAGPSRPGRVSDLRVRAIAALLLGPAVLFLAWLGGWAFAVLAAVSGVVLVGEWNGVSRGRYVDQAVLVAGICVFVSVLLFGAGQEEWAAVILVVGVLAGQALAWRTDPARLFAAGMLYAALPMLALVCLRGDADYGRIAVIWLMMIVWATDVGAYFSGRLIGGPKLAPRISPKKTWAGAVGGVACAVMVGIVIAGLLQAGDAVSLAILAGVLSAVSQAGDLFESAFKRRFGAKDSSRLLPGHGGMMDRIDGLVAAAFFAGIVGISRGGLHSAGSGLMLW